jgi:hypothetical protein
MKNSMPNSGIIKHGVFVIYAIAVKPSAHVFSYMF